METYYVVVYKNGAPITKGKMITSHLRLLRRKVLFYLREYDCSEAYLYKNIKEDPVLRVINTGKKSKKLL